MFFEISSQPSAYANIFGNSKYPEIKGKVFFFEVHGGTVVVAKIQNLPGEGFHGFHIHEGFDCTNGIAIGGHYNPQGVPHPDHAGDFPSLLSNKGMAFLGFYTDRFYPEDIIGRVSVIHGGADDFKTQPSGNPGEMIACGKIIEYLPVE